MRPRARRRPPSEALGAASAGDGLDNLDLFAVLIRDEVAYEDQAVVADVWTLFSGWVRTKALKAGVVSVEGVVMYPGGVH